MPDNFQLRSEQVQDIIGYIPHWIIRWGIMVIFAFVLVLLAGTWFFKYPDVISSTIRVTTSNPPSSIIARAGGNIRHLFVQDNQQVAENDVLAVIRNPADYFHVAGLKKHLADFGSGHGVRQPGFQEDYRLGELQSVYASFLRIYADYQVFTELDYHHKKIGAIQEQIEKYRQLHKYLLKQKTLLAQQVGMSRKRHERFSLKKNKDLISRQEFEDLESRILTQKYSLEGAGSEIANLEIRVSELEKSILELELDYEEKKHNLESGLRRAYDNLISSIAAWEHKYVLKSPICGTVSFTKYWTVHQNVGLGDVVMTVVSGDTRIVGKAGLPVHGAGKVSPGQDVIIRFASFPHTEYGMVRAKVEKISLVPDEEYYAAEVGFPGGLGTTYGKTLPFKQEMQGTAEIVTEDIRLLERILGPVKSVLKKMEISDADECR